MFENKFQKLFPLTSFIISPIFVCRLHNSNHVIHTAVRWLAIHLNAPSVIGRFWITCSKTDKYMNNDWLTADHMCIDVMRVLFETWFFWRTEKNKQIYIKISIKNIKSIKSFKLFLRTKFIRTTYILTWALSFFEIFEKIKHIYTFFLTYIKSSQVNSR